MKGRDFEGAKKVVKEWCGAREGNPYFQDLRFVLDGMEDRSYPNDDYLCEEILQMLEKEGEFPEELAFTKPEDKDVKTFYEKINQILKVGNGSSGKNAEKTEMELFWQMQVNIALRKGDEKGFEEYGRILSIPVSPEKEGAAPQKLAIIKELLANDLVERAKYLAKYEDPDWAYEEHKFLNGEKEEKAYSSEVGRWYGFKEEKINDHGMLLACTDSKTPRKVDELLSAVPLGNPVQQKQFYENVLQPLEKECYASREKIVERKNKYAEVRKEFLAQWENVQKLQKELSEYQFKMIRTLSDKELREKTLAEARSAVEHNEMLISDAETIVNGYQADRQALDKDMEELSEKLSQETAKLKELEKQINECKQKTTEGFAKSEETLKAVNGLTKLFSKKKYDAAVELSDQYHKEACEAQDLDLKLSKEAKDLGSGLRDLLDTQSALEEKRNYFTEEIGKRNREINSCKTTIEKKQAEIMETEALLKETIAEYDNLLDEMEKSGADGKREILDKVFLAELFSEDEKVSAKRRLQIPWVTPKYDEERVKLRQLAESLCAEFARSSHHYRENLITLEQYWGLRNGDDGKKIAFHPQDSAIMVPALYQTLAVIAPVISISLEEVADMLADIKKPGIFGRCVIDLGECDEMDSSVSPKEKIVGTLFRGRQAVIFSERESVKEENMVTEEENA